MTDRRELREIQLIGELSHYGWRISPDKRTMRKYTPKEIEEIEALTAGEEVLNQLVERRSAPYPYTCRIGPAGVSEWSLTGDCSPVLTLSILWYIYPLTANEGSLAAWVVLQKREWHFRV